MKDSSHQPATPHRREVNALSAFRGETRASPRLHPLEKALVIVVSIHLCFMPWALGTMHVWSQAVSLGFSIVEIILALINRQYDEDTSNEGRFKLVMWPKLVRFPIFWMGLALLLYITIQGLNPSWAYRTDGKVWWMQPIEHIKWLPTGMETPFKDMNAWRMLIIISAILLSTCALWTGFTTHRSAKYILITISLSGTLIATAGILHKFAGNDKILWLFERGPHVNSYFGPFIYKNHAGAFLNITLAVSMALTLNYFLRKICHQLRTEPSPLFLLCSCIIAIGVTLTQSRAALMLSITLVLGACLATRLTPLRNRPIGPKGLLKLTTLTVCLILAGYSVGSTDSIKNIGNLFSRDRVLSVEQRSAARTATFEMAQAKLMTGWGAGSFRHFFPMFQQNFPKIATLNGQTLRWEYAHNDYAQGLAEFGVFGTVLLVSSITYFILSLIRLQAYRDGAITILLAGLFTTLAHAWVDFPLYNPAISLYWVTILAISCKWAEVARQRI